MPARPVALAPVLRFLSAPERRRGRPLAPRSALVGAPRPPASRCRARFLRRSGRWWLRCPPARRC
ncbi:hypothetical protein C3R44_22840, partial [Mycobacterium tuberculosis]